MSYISTMAVPDGIVMLGDMLQSRGKSKSNEIPDIPLVGSKYYKKLYAMNNSVGISFATRGNKYESKGIEIGRLIKKFCEEKPYTSPAEAARALREYIKYGGGTAIKDEFDKMYALDGEPEYVIHIAGLNESITPPTPTSFGSIQLPGVYTICTAPDLLQMHGSHIVDGSQRVGFWQCGNMRQIKEYVETINNDKDFITHCTLQDAIDATMYIYNAARGFEWMIDRIETISERFELLVITKDGIKWLKQHELEVKENEHYQSTP